MSIQLVYYNLNLNNIAINHKLYTNHLEQLILFENRIYIFYTKR